MTTTTTNTFEICPMFNEDDVLTGYTFDVLTADGSDVWGCYWLVSDLIDNNMVSASETLVSWDVNGVPEEVAEHIISSLNETMALGAEWSQDEENRVKAALAAAIITAAKEA